MQNRSRNWTDVQLIVSSISIALTLGFWGLFASREKRVAPVVGEASDPAPTDALTPTSTALLPGQIFYVNGATPSALPTVVAQTQPKRRKDGDKGGGGDRGGGGGGGGSTGSS